MIFPRKKRSCGTFQTPDQWILTEHQPWKSRNWALGLLGSVFPQTHVNSLASFSLHLFSPLQKEDTTLSLSTQCSKPTQ